MGLKLKRKSTISVSNQNLFLRVLVVRDESHLCLESLNNVFEKKPT